MYPKVRWPQHLLTLIVIALASSAALAEPRLRPTEWASPVIGSQLDNLYKVSDKIYRSEQPNAKAFAELESIGITTVLNLRNHHTDDDEAKKTKLKLERVEMNAGSITPQQVQQSLDRITKAKGPVLVHCWHGSDRTGTVVAAYRMVVQDWSKKAAIDEFKNGGFGYHARIYPELVDLLENLDVPAMQLALGLKAATE